MTSSFASRGELTVCARATRTQNSKIGIERRTFTQLRSREALDAGFQPKRRASVFDSRPFGKCFPKLDDGIRPALMLLCWCEAVELCRLCHQNDVRGICHHR